MSQKPKLSPEDEKLLLNFCKTLPKIYVLNKDGEFVKTQEIVRGRALTDIQKRNYEKATKKKVKPHVLYGTAVFLEKQPFPYIKKAFIEGGKDAAVEACKKWIKDAEAQKQRTIPKTTPPADSQETPQS